MALGEKFFFVERCYDQNGITSSRSTTSLYKYIIQNRIFFNANNISAMISYLCVRFSMKFVRLCAVYVKNRANSSEASCMEKMSIFDTAVMVESHTRSVN